VAAILEADSYMMTDDARQNQKYEHPGRLDRHQANCGLAHNRFGLAHG
jgi:hypothetical protein